MNNFVTKKIEVSIHNIKPNPFNPNFMDAPTFRKEVESIKQLGMIGSIIVRDHIVPGYYEILDGEHRWKAAVELGYTLMQVETIGQIPDSMMKFLTVHLNNLHGKDDIFKRAAILKDLDAGQTQLLPFTTEEIDNEKKLISFDFSQYEREAELPERKFAMVVVLPLNVDEAKVWQAAKDELVARKLITVDNSKKKQDIQAIMKMIEFTLGLTIGFEQMTLPVESEAMSDKESELNAIADSYSKSGFHKPIELNETKASVPQTDTDYPGS